jgi:DNA-binding Lrp family transcriptional regulator
MVNKKNGNATIVDIGIIAQLRFEPTLKLVKELLDLGVLKRRETQDGIFYETILA